MYGAIIVDLALIAIFGATMVGGAQFAGLPATVKGLLGH
jgi:hypothetical protein